MGVAQTIFNPYIINVLLGQLSQVKSETETPGSKKRKTEWQSGLKKLPGDTSLAKDRHLYQKCLEIIDSLREQTLSKFGQDVFGYLAMFSEPAAAGTTVSNTHPADLVMNAFKDPDTSAATVAKLKQFLEEGMKIHSKKLLIAPTPEACQHLEIKQLGLIFCGFSHKIFLQQQRSTGSQPH